MAETVLSNMIRRDYHNFLVGEALRDAERVIGEVRMDGKAEEARFITGYGMIRQQLFELLQTHGLEPTYELGNQGVILVDIV
jgi:hypothetical protein